MRAVITAVLTLPLLLTACGRAPAGHSGTPRTTLAKPAATATLSHAQHNYVNDLSTALSAKGQQSTESAATLAQFGTDTCKALRAGATPTQLLNRIHSPDGRVFVRLAERDLCPSYLPRVLIRLSGSGIANSRPFLVPTGTVTVRYSYNCASTGNTGNFIADLETGNQASPGSDDQSIANALGNGGSQTTTIYPTDPGANYHLAVNSECLWSITARNG